MMKKWIYYAGLFVVLTMVNGCGTQTPLVKTQETPGAVKEISPTSTTKPADEQVEPTSTEELMEEAQKTPTQVPTLIPSLSGFLLENVGFATPESVLYNPEADIYLVANINGSPSAKDGNGFISSVSPDGEIIELKWIDGATEGIMLNAPKGMALTTAGLYVADIDTVRLFNRETGDSIKDFPVQGAVFLNDVAADTEENIYVSDSGSGRIIAISPDGDVTDVMPAGSIQGPNGLEVWDGLVHVTSGKSVFAIEEGALIKKFSLPQGSLDGLIFLDDGNILVSSWSASAVYKAQVEGDTVQIASGVPSPADIGFDPLRGYILIPRFNGNALDVRPLP